MKDFPEHISALYQRPQSDWEAREWRTLAHWLVQEKESALEGWGNAVVELEQAVANAAMLRESLDLQLRRSKLTSDILTFCLSNQRPVRPSIKVRGRQSKDIDPQLMLSAFEGMLSEYVAANPFEKPSDPKVLTWWFEKQFASMGLRTTTVRTSKFQAKLKTLRNRLSDIRNPIRKLPVK